MSHLYQSPEDSTEFAWLMEPVCKAIKIGDKPGFTRAARELKARFPINVDFMQKPYNMNPGYEHALRDALPSLQDPATLAWFAKELVLTPLLAFNLSRCTTGMDEQILDALALDKVVHNVERVVPLKDDEPFPIFDLGPSLRLLRLFLMKDPSCQLTAKGITALLENQEIICSNFKAEDILLLDTHYETMQALADMAVETSPLALVKHLDDRINDVLNERNLIFSRTAKVTKLPGALNQPHNRIVTLDAINKLVSHGMLKTAEAVIKDGHLSLQNYQEATDLIAALPELSSSTLQATFKNLINQNPFDVNKIDLKYLFAIAHELNVKLDMGSERYQVNYFTHAFNNYLRDHDHETETMQWAVEFFDNALSVLPDKLIKNYRILDLVTQEVGDQCLRLKRLTLEDDLGM